MQLAVMDPADRNGEFVAHTAPECSRLCKGEMMRIRGHAAAHEARLSQYESPVILIAQANRFSQGTDCTAARLLLAGPHRCFLAGTRVRRGKPCPEPPGQVIKDVQSWVRHPVIRWMAATLDGVVEGTGAVFEAKFMLPWSFSEEAAAEKHMAQVQHNMWVTNATDTVLSIITGGGKWAEIKISADPLYQHLLLTAEKKFWRCVESGEPPRLFGVESPRARIEAMRVIDMSSSNAWASIHHHADDHLLVPSRHKR